MRIILLCAIALLYACGGSGSGTGVETATYDNLAAMDFDNMNQEEKDKAAYEIFEKFCDTCKAQSLVDFLDALDLEVQERNNMPGQTERFDRKKALVFIVHKELDSEFISLNFNVNLYASQRLYGLYSIDYYAGYSIYNLTASIVFYRGVELYFRIDFINNNKPISKEYKHDGLPLFDSSSHPIRTHLKK